MRIAQPGRKWPIQFILLGYGVLNVVLYAGLLPLWDGFDEPFHYGIVQQWSRHAAPPVLGSTVLSQEIWDSLADAPVSWQVRANIGIGTSFQDYFRLPVARRIEMRSRLETLPPREAREPARAPNYEAQQAPLAYLLLAPLDALWDGKPLVLRVLLLRLVCGIAAVLGTGLAMFWLADLLGMPHALGLSAVLLVFSSQMLHGAVAHIANDWLVLPLFAFLLGRAILLYSNPGRASAALFGLALGAALLTKASFLPLVPFAVGLVILCCCRRKLLWRQAALFAALFLSIAGPWYGRNLALYRNLSGMQEATYGTPPRQILHAAVALPWGEALLSTARHSLWTGNNSFFTLSSVTIWIMLGLLAAGVCLYVIRVAGAGLPSGERIVLSGLFCYLLGLVYAAVVAFWWSKGAAFTPAPWYVQALLPPGMLLVLQGTAHGDPTARALRIALLWVWVYQIALTWLAKLIPFYAGFSSGRARLADLPRWYAEMMSGSYGALGTIALLPPPVLLVLAAVSICSAAALAAKLSGWRVSAQRST